MPVPISVFIITKNEEARLGRTLAAVAWAEQIIVVDSGSTDRTLEIAAAAGAEIHHRDWQGYGQQKSFAESLCRHDWVLNLDADEVVTSELAEEIRAFLARDPAPSACRIRILNVYPGSERPRFLANDYNEIRLYHHAIARYRAHPLFDRVETDAEPLQLRAPIHHFPVVSWGQLVAKLNAYSDFSAASAAPRARRKLLLRLPFEMPFAFFRFYVLRRHFTGGWQGFAFALISAFGRTLRIIKLLQRAEEAERQNRSENGGAGGV
ncbi:MAG TPA: glycosyltransferase family 2 protein [Paracoccaceae bacterium]|nr:glycosyltransferase family 2 protein [Paracoccaceae bacterium]